MNERKGTRIGRRIIRTADRIVDFLVLFGILLLILIGVYALWDANRVYETAKAERYAMYKPEAEDTEGFEELKAINPEVVGWLTVYGTGIDYPLTQADGNEKYVNTDVHGRYSMTGSLFLDYRNSPYFEDFNTIIYGHHMAEDAMFGGLDQFVEKEYFEGHRFGALFSNGREYGLELFAFLPADAYDGDIYKPGITDEAERTAYLAELLRRAVQSRDIGVTAGGRLVLMSTCTEGFTNGRYILAARITDEAQADPFETDKPVPDKKAVTKESNRNTGCRWRQVSCLVWIIMLALLLFLIAAAGYTIVKHRKKSQRKEP
jgi:sortase B